MTPASRYLWLLAFWVLTACATNPQSGDQTRADDPVETLLSRMTLEEKLGQLTSVTPGKENLSTLIEKGEVGTLFSIGPEDTSKFQRIAMERSRLKIPLLIGNDIIHGYRTIFPIPLAIASSWDPELAELSAKVAALEARAAGTHWTFAPMVDIARDPRWGRIAEGAGEDPFLGGAMAAAYVQGFQQRDLSNPDSVLSCAKHYAAYGAAEAGRDYNSTDMSERTLREVYLPPFKAAVDKGVGTLMSSFNALNGVPATANRHLLHDILRREWKFSGFVITDYEAIEQLIDHGVAQTSEDAAIKAITAGVDMDMVDNSFATLAEAVRSGRVSESRVDESVRRVLRAKFRLGLFDNPYGDPERAVAVTMAQANLEASRKVARKSIVLLKNDGDLLPLAKTTRTIAVIGPLADSKQDMLGSWAASGKAEEAVSVLEGLKAKASPETRLLYAKGTDILSGSNEGIAEALEVVKRADVTVAVLGESREMTGEAASRVSLDLPGRQQELLELLVATGKPLVLVVMSGRPLTISWAAENVPAILWTGFLGSQAGHALADVLFGDVNPSGKLPVTFPRSVGQIPIYHSHLNTGRPPTDHKYTSKYLDSPNEPLFPFGHGLSYTRFHYENFRLSAPTMGMNGTLIASVDVRNVGERTGEEIVQLYVNDVVGSVARPVKALKGFQRVTLSPGGTKSVEFVLTPEVGSFWSDSGWIAEPGTFRIWIGPSSAEGLEGSFELVESSNQNR